MKLQQFLGHHSITSNPFADEDAQTDPVFKSHCIDHSYHPAWDKIFGNPMEPATAIVFGEKGAGKTALRLQVARHLEEYNRAHPNARVFVVEYDDFNPFLDRFHDRVSVRQRRRHAGLDAWKLWDHMDSLLSLAVTQLVDRVLGERGGRRAKTGEAEAPLAVESLSRPEARDLLLLTACYDRSPAVGMKQRWHQVRRKLGIYRWPIGWDLVLGVAAVAAVVGVVVGLKRWEWLARPWPYALAAAGWMWWLWNFAQGSWTAWRIRRQVRVLNHEISSTRAVLGRFGRRDLSGQPLPVHARTDDRYELLDKLQGVLSAVGYTGMIALVDRVDEPHLVNGSAEQMRALMWPMLDNKFLKQAGLGLKLLLPVELLEYANREDRDFYQRARLDKQNMVPSLDWSGEALFDVANERIEACAADGAAPKLRDLMDEEISDRRLIEALASLRVPRHMFKFLYRLFVAHCNAHTDAEPVWRVSSPTFESVLAVYQRDQDAADRGVGAG